MSRCPDSFRVGDVFIAGSYVVTPTVVADHHRARVLRELMEQPGDGSGRVAQHLPTSGVCPPTLLVSGAIARVREVGAFQDLVMDFRAPGRLKVLAPAVVGEPIACIATVRYRSRNREGSVLLTLGVELRRRRGGTLARFEVALELSEGTVCERPEEAGRNAA